MNAFPEVIKTSFLQHKKRYVTAFAFITVLVLLFLVFYPHNGNRLTAQPENVADQLTTNFTTQSTLTLVTKIPYDNIKDLISTRTANPLPLSGSSRMGCVKVPYVIGPHVGSHQECGQVPYCDFRGCGTQEQCVNVPDFYGPSIGQSDQCADLNWHAMIAREGDPTVQNSNGRIHIEVPSRVDGQAGLNGTLAPILSLSGKNFEAHVRPVVDVTVDVGEDWCPIVNATPTNNWVSSANVEVVGKNCAGIDLGQLGHPEVCAGPANLDLTSAANDALNARQSEISDAVRGALTCQAVKDNVSKEWKNYSIDLGEQGDSKLYLNIRPTSAAFSGLIAQDDGIKLVTQIGAVTEISNQAISPTTTGLPALGKMDSNTSHLTVITRATVPFDQLSAAISHKLKGKEFNGSTRFGRARIRIDDFSIYPNHKSVVVGVKISAKIPGRIFDANGWVYVLGTPVVGPSGRDVKIGNIHYALLVDNKIWPFIVDIFDKQIMSKLVDNSNVDLTSILNDTSTNILSKINDTKIVDVTVVAEKPVIVLKKIEVGNKGLSAVAALDIEFTVNGFPHAR